MRRKLWQFSNAIFCWLFADLRNYFAVEEERIMIRSMKDYEVHSEREEYLLHRAKGFG